MFSKRAKLFKGSLLRMLLSVMALVILLASCANQDIAMEKAISVLSFADRQIQWFRVSDDGNWVLVTVLDKTLNATTLTRKIDSNQDVTLPLVLVVPPVRFAVSSDETTLIIHQANGTIATFRRDSKANDLWQTMDTSTKTHPGKKVWVNFSLISHHGLKLEKQEKPDWFPYIEDFSQNIIYAEQPIQQGYIAFLTESPFECYLWLINASGDDLRQLATVRDVSIYSGHRPFSWDAKGQKFFYEVPSIAQEKDAIWLFNASTRTTSLLVDNACYPKASPDGQLLGYRKPPYRETLETMNIGSGRLVQKFAGRLPLTWSPDGRYFTFVTARNKYPAVVQFLRSFPFVLESPEENYFINVVNHESKVIKRMPTEIYGMETPLPDWTYLEQWRGNNIQWSENGKRVCFLKNLNTIGYATF